MGHEERRWRGFEGIQVERLYGSSRSSASTRRSGPTGRARRSRSRGASASASTPSDPSSARPSPPSSMRRHEQRDRVHQPGLAAARPRARRRPRPSSDVTPRSPNARSASAGLSASSRSTPSGGGGASAGAIPQRPCRCKLEVPPPTVPGGRTRRAGAGVRPAVPGRARRGPDRPRAPCRCPPPRRPPRPASRGRAAGSREMRSSGSHPPRWPSARRATPRA